MTVADLIAKLQATPQDLDVHITNGDLPDVPAASVTIAAADFGQLVLISR